MTLRAIAEHAPESRRRRGMKIGDRVRVKQDTKAYGPGSFVPSTHAGEIGTIVAMPSTSGYDVGIWPDDQGPIPEEASKFNLGFRFEEVEYLENEGR